MTEKALDCRTRRAASRVGLQARKSRLATGTIDNAGGYRLIDPYRNCIVSGERFDLTAEEVTEHCKDMPTHDWQRPARMWR
jgi:hypothetical protein